MPESELALTPVRTVRELLRAARQVRRLATDNPTHSAFMHRYDMRSDASRESRPTEWTDLERVSPVLICALVGAEDPAFFQHKGFWWSQLILTTLRAWLLRRRVGGVSTITQQLARNLFLAPERSMLRKLKEAILTYRLERVLSKRRILELYLNVVEWGDDVWGIKAAARTHCACEPEQLDGFQSVVLVSLLPAPRVPLAGWNATRATRTQRRLPIFLYAAGMVDREAERDLSYRVARLASALEQGRSLREAMKDVGTLPRPSIGVRATSVTAVLADHCGWARRLRFEDALRGRKEMRQALGARPLWWTETASLGGDGDADRE